MDGKITGSFREAIKIYNKVYYLPVLSGPEYSALQGKLKEHKIIISKGSRRVKFLFGLFSRKEALTIEERFEQLDDLKKDYDLVLGSLRKHRYSYEEFFVELTNELEQIVKERYSELSRLEIQRQEMIGRMTNKVVIQELKNQKRELVSYLIKLAKGTILMLKKIERLSMGIKKLSEDMEVQRNCLDKMSANIMEYREYYEFYKKLNQAKKRIDDFVQASKDFEDKLNPALGEVDKLITEASNVDRDLHRVVTEIKGLVGEMMDFDSISSPEIEEDEFNKYSFDFLIANEGKKFHIHDAMENIRDMDENADIHLEIEIEKTLNNFQTNLSTRLINFRSQFFNIEQILSLIKEAEKCLVNNEYEKAGDYAGRILSIEPTYARAKELMEISNTELKKTREIQKKEQNRKDLKSKIIDSGMNCLVNIDNRLYLCEHPVTQEEYSNLTELNPSKFKAEKNPVENVSWHDAIEYCNKRSLNEGLEPVYNITGDNIAWDRDKFGYRLPTEEEWEYAAKGGSGSRGCKYSGSNNIDEVAWHYSNSENAARPVRQRKANELGLYDMSGNVWEWCWDRYKEGAPCRMVRGGSWNNSPEGCAITSRSEYSPDYKCSYIGFRIALDHFNK